MRSLLFIELRLPLGKHLRPGALAVEPFNTRLAMDAFDEAVLSRTSPRGERRSDSGIARPAHDHRPRELHAAVRTYRGLSALVFGSTVDAIVLRRHHERVCRMLTNQH